MGQYISPDITAGTYVRARLIVDYTANAASNNNSCKAYVQAWRTNADYTGTTSGSGTLYIKTEDDSGWWTSSVTDSQKVSYNSYTQLGSTRSLTINNDSTGRRTIKFYVKATNNATANLDFDQQEFSVTLDPCPVYNLSISAGTGSSITVNRTSSAGSTGNLSAGTKKLYYGDKLKITFTPSTNYSITTHTVNGSSFTSGNTHTVSANVTVNATATPLKSLVSATDANIGSTSSIIITRYNKSYTHTLTYNFGGLTGTIETKTTETTIPWPVPDAFYAKIPNDPDGICTITCTTYNGSTPLGSTTCTMIATAAKNKCAPTVTVTAADSNEATIALTGDPQKIIRYHSDIEATADISSRNSANLIWLALECGNSGYTLDLSGTTQKVTKTFTKVEGVDVFAEVIDSREYGATDRETDLTLIEYIKLTNNAEAVRTEPTSDEVKVTAKGYYFNGSFGAVDNTLKLQVRYKPKSKTEYDDTDAWTDMAVTLDGNSYTAETTITGLVYTQIYDIEVRASDQIYKDGGPLENAVYRKIALNKGIPLFDWGEEDFNFNVPVTFNAAILRNGEDFDEHAFYEEGDTLTQAENTAYAGMITGSTKNLYFFIPLSKPVFTQGLELSGTVIGRGVNGYINGTDGTNSQIPLENCDEYTVEAWAHGNGICVRITFASAIANATNNTPVTVVPYGNLTIRFY